MSKFNVGDRVKVTTPGIKHHGYSGIIVRKLRPNMVKFDKCGCHTSCWDEELTLINVGYNIEILGFQNDDFEKELIALVEKYSGELVLSTKS